MSTKKLNIFDYSFDSYGIALGKYLDYVGLSKKWLATELHRKGTKPSIGSLQSMITRWSKGDPVSEDYQKRINNIIDTEIKQDNTGKWKISLSMNSDSASDEEESIPFELRLLRSRLETEGISNKERDLIVDRLLTRSKTLLEEAQMLHELLEVLKTGRSDE